MEVTGQEYRQMNKKAAPKSPVLLNCLKAFLIGGLICTIAEVIVELLMNFAGMEQKEARLIGSISLIFLSVLLTGFNVYDNIAKHAGPVRWCLSPALPTPWFRRRSSLNPRALSSGWVRRCFPSRARCWCTASAPPSCTG